MIDLHCHSYFSDGTHSPDELISKALAANLSQLALTDHDTVAGLTPLHAAAEGKAIRIINGIEFSTQWKKYDVHVLGLNIDPQEEAIQSLIKQQSERRIARAKLIGDKIESLGVKNAYERACQLAGHERIGRPHFAQLFIEDGLVPTMQTAFKRYLGKGKPAYVATAWASIPEAIAAIVQAKGQSVLAHPLSYNLTRTKLHELLLHFKEAGGVGIEVVSGEMTVGEIQEMAGLCMRYDFMASSGSDFHDDKLSRVPLGRQRQLPLHCKAIWTQWAS